MGNLSKESVNQITKVLETCLAAGFEKIVIENSKDGNSVRGMSEDQTCLLVTNEGGPSLDGAKALGLSRLNILKSRIGVINGIDKEISVSTEVNAKGEVSSLQFKGERAKTQFRCASPSIIKAPKGVNDQEFVKISIKKEDVNIISNAIRAMQAKTLSLVGKLNKDTDNVEVFIEILDATQDVFSIKVCDAAEFIDDSCEDSVFAFDYLASIFTALLKQNVSCLKEDEPVIELLVGQIGSIWLKIYNNVFIILQYVEDQKEQDNE